MHSHPFFILSLITIVWCVGGCGPSPEKAATTPPQPPPGSILAEPLPTRPAHEGPLFESLTAARTGVSFLNQGPPQQVNAQGEVEYFRSQSGSDTSGGVTLGDVDNDGLTDIYLTRAQGGNRLYRNVGGLRFEDITEKAGLTKGPAWGTGASFVDFDNDGDLDLYACGYQCPNAFYLNRGDGTFEERAADLGLAFNGASVMISFADYDLDGDIDGYLLTNHLETPGEMQGAPVRVNPITRQVEVPPAKREVMGALLKPDGSVKAFLAGQYDHLLRNEMGRNGALQAFTEVSTASGIDGADMGLSATWWDYDDDGFPDLYVANDFYGADQLYHNEKDGTFKETIASAIPHTPWFSMGADAGDLNNDGRLDFMASDMAGTNHYKSKMGMGDMEDQNWFLTYPEPRQYMRNAVYINSGTSRFFEAAYLTNLAKSDWTWSVKIADLDNDGWNDVFLTNGMTRDLFQSDLKENEKNLPSRDLAKTFWSKAPEKRDANLAFRNQRDLHFENASSAWGLDHVGISFGAALGDLDNDGDLDLVVNHYGEPTEIYQNHSTGNVLRFQLEGVATNRQALGTRVTLTTAHGTQTQELSLAHGYMSTNQPIVHFGLGDLTEVAEAIVHWPGKGLQRLTNLKANHLYRVKEPINHEPRTLPEESPLFVPSSILAGTGRMEKPFDDFARQPLLPNQLSQLGPAMAWGDIDGDGDQDLYIGGPAGQPGLLCRRDESGFTKETPFPNDAACEDMGVLFFDADTDGDLDLYVASGGVECEPGDAVLQDRLYLNDGSGRFSKTDALPEMHDSASAVVAADYDRDGDLDLFIGGRVIPGQWPATPRSHLLRNEGNHFVDEDIPGLTNAGLVTNALWTDVDGDAWPDLMLTTEWGAVRCFHNQAGKLINETQASGLGDRLGWWNAITHGDVDGDGDLDYAVTNFGLNTQYHPSEASPELLYYGDFDGSGNRQILEAKQEGNTTLPRRGFSCSRNAMPFLRDKFKTFHNFATSTLETLYTPEKLSAALEFKVTTLENGILINESTPTQIAFRFLPLPRLAQIAPSYGAAFLDANADGKLDLCLAQNFFTPQRETGRMDGGLSLLLLGVGDGTFTPLMPKQSGIVVPGDAKSLTTVDLNGDGTRDLIFGINNADPAVFIHRPKIQLP